MKVSELQDIKQRYKIVGNCASLNHALDVALQVAPTDLSVLIVGESGVGKEVIPRVIHDSSPRRRGKYFAINCGSIPEGTIDSELFGHVKGSFTGAIGDSPGYFGAADKGTLFLDEVGELPLATQARLLRVLETGEYIPVGATDVRKTDVRVVAATNVNMQRAISEGRFREDLYYRLNSIPIHMPPLRERGDDIPLLFRFFAMQMAEKYKMEKVVLTEGARTMLMKYKWPGNIRQLKNVTEQISILSPQRDITPEVLSEFIPQDMETTQLVSMNHHGDSDHSFESEREILYKILYELRGHVNELTQEIAELKKKLNTTANTPAVASTQKYLPRVTEDAEAEEYVELSNVADRMTDKKKTESLNLETIEKQMLIKALERNNGNRKKAAEELGYSDRTLYRRLKQYGLEDY
ncbi:MAG: sigma-54 interaction domain-containing protein [Prevotella sp.]